SSWSMHRLPPDAERFRPHCEPFFPACNQKVAHMNCPTSGIHSYLHSSCGCNHDLSFPALSEQKSRTLGHDTGHRRVVSPRGGYNEICLLRIQCNDRAGRDLPICRNPFGDILILGRDVPGYRHVANYVELSGWRRGSNADTTRKRGDVLPGNESELCHPILHVIKEEVVRRVATDSEAPRSGWSGIPEPRL